MLDRILRMTSELPLRPPPPILLPTPPKTIPPRFNPTHLRNITKSDREIPSCTEKFPFPCLFPLTPLPSFYPLRPTLPKPIPSPTFNWESFSLTRFSFGYMCLLRFIIVLKMSFFAVDQFDTKIHLLHLLSFNFDFRRGHLTSATFAFVFIESLFCAKQLSNKSESNFLRNKTFLQSDEKSGFILNFFFIYSKVYSIYNLGYTGVVTPHALHSMLFLR